MTAKAGTKRHSWKRIIARDTGAILYWCPKCQTWKIPGEPSGVCPGKRNPGTNWHVTRADELRNERSRQEGVQWDYTNQRVLENKYAADASRHLGMNPRERPYVSPFYGLTWQEKDVLISAKSGGAIYRGKDMIFWTTIAKGLARKGFVKYKENAFILTSKGRTAIQELGLSNPGAAWHGREVVFAELAKMKSKDYKKGYIDANVTALTKSKLYGMPNPSPGKLFKNLLPIGLIVGLVWLINKNKAQ